MTGNRMTSLIASWRRRCNSGSAAVEFAFVAPVFFIFLMGIIEGGIMFFGQAAVMNATQDAARLIRTGQAQGTIDQGAFKQKVCDGITPLLTCGNLQVDVQAYPSGFNGSQSDPTDSSGNLKSGQNNYSTGGPCDVVVVRAFYKYTIVTPVLYPILGKGNNFSYLTGAAAFRNEPYTSAVSGC